MPKVIQFKVQLFDIEPEIWRRIVLPASFTLFGLHAVIQAVMGWQDGHLHMFVIDGQRYGLPDDDQDSNYSILEEANHRLNSLLSEGQKFLYVYDFGDDWRHEITVEDIRDGSSEEVLPTCIAGERACPPEDCGGPHMYPEFLEALSDPSHEDHDHYAEIYGEIDPEQFDLRFAQKRLAELPKSP
jgi:hypothetical protein